MLKIRDIWHPRKSLPETLDKMFQIRQVQYYTGRLATLVTDQFKTVRTNSANSNTSRRLV